jgi:Integrase core domain
VAIVLLSMLWLGGWGSGRRLVYYATESEPRGWYLARPVTRLLTHGQLIVFPVPPHVALHQLVGWTLKRILTDGGSEFKAEFDQACVGLGFRHTGTKPRHAWTNGFVERLQQTVLTEHWRIQFRRRYPTRLARLKTSLQGVLRFYNGERPHQGYRLRGRTPASVFWGAARPEE